MIFQAEMLEAEETSKHLKVLYGQEIGPHFDMCNQLRLHDEQNGMSRERHYQHLASIPEIAVMVLMQERPEVFRDSKEFEKWLKTDVGKEFRVSRDAKPVKGDGLQVIVR